MFSFIKKLFKYEIVLYGFVGGLTTIIAIAVFQLSRIFINVNTDSGLSWKLAEAISFIISVIFAFFADKIIVFKDLDMRIQKIVKEFFGFVSGRIVSEGINFFIMWFMIDVNRINVFVTKILACIVVIIINYIISKFFIFRKKK